jgi:small subunit ribosomal protein S9
MTLKESAIPTPESTGPVPGPTPAVEPAQKPAPAVSREYYYGTGRRKTAVARVRLYPGTGNVTVNDKSLLDYFGRAVSEGLILQPLRTTNLLHKFNVVAKVEGGGLSGQAGALSHGIARALLEADENLRALLRKGGFLTRDPRVKERKKPGLRRARKAKQYTKR